MNSTQENSDFDPNGVGKKGALFGLPYVAEEADLVIIPVPWEVTVSYGAGTVDGPSSILEASTQIDLQLHGIEEPWNHKIAMLPVQENLIHESEKYRSFAYSYIQSLEEGSTDDPLKVIPKAINEVCEKLNIWVENQSANYLSEGKTVAVLGGDHSTPLGLLRALGKTHNEFGVLQIDAHADLRRAYEEFAFSHASIMFNTLAIPSLKKLVQVGIRDYCEEELKRIKKYPERITTFFDEDLKSRQFKGETWDQQCNQIVNSLPKNVYISLDIDGLDPSLCPNTGTPVPGGLSFEQCTHLIKKVVESGRKIIGFDLSEVSPGENNWDANVGARLLYYLSCWTGVSGGKLEVRVER